MFVKCQSVVSINDTSTYAVLFMYHYDQLHYCIYTKGIKHGFSCMNICQVPREVLKPRSATWRMSMHRKYIFSRYYCIKTVNVCYISRYFRTIFFRLFTSVSRMAFPRILHFPGSGSKHNKHLVTTADRFESAANMAT